MSEAECLVIFHLRRQLFLSSINLYQPITAYYTLLFAYHFIIHPDCRYCDVKISVACIKFKRPMALCGVPVPMVAGFLDVLYPLLRQFLGFSMARYGWNHI